MQIFNMRNVFAVLPRADGTCFVSTGRHVWHLDPQKPDDVYLNRRIRASPGVCKMSFVGTNDDPERYVQIFSGDVSTPWVQGYDTSTPHPPGHWNVGQYPRAWSCRVHGVCAGVGQKDRFWFMQFSNFTNHRGAFRRTTIPSQEITRYKITSGFSLVPRTRLVLTASLINNEYQTANLVHRLFDLDTGHFTLTTHKSDFLTDASVLDDYTNIPTQAGTVVFVNTQGRLLAEVTVDPDSPKTTTYRTEVPSWYPEFPETVGGRDSHPSACILHDRSAWITNKGEVKMRTAENPSLTRAFRPDGRRRVRGCAFAADGLTLWFFDSAKLYRVDLD